MVRKFLKRRPEPEFLERGAGKRFAYIMFIMFTELEDSYSSS